jgi:hypothetical protein
MGFIEKQRDRYVWKSGDIHVPQNSPLAALHHQHWRMRAIEDAQLQREGQIHFTVCTPSPKKISRM